MEDKEKQIEEMAKDIEFAIDDAKKRGWYIKNAKKDGWVVEKLLPILIAEQISEKYQPKFPEDSVVISKEEYNELKYFPNKQLSYTEKLQRDAESYQKLTDNLISKISRLEEELVNSRKETAEKFMEWLQDNELINLMFTKEYKQKLVNDFLAKQLGVEIKES